jgi:predicted CXXCH cytochrome family protein
MTFRIRQIERTATGREIVRDRDVAGETLTIGRSADNDVHLPDLAVEPRHAEITQAAGGRLRVEAVGTLGFVVDGAETRSASIDSIGGAELGFGTYRLTVSQDQGAVLLTIRKVGTAATRSGDLEGKRGFSLAGVLPGKRRMSWALAVVILLAFLAVPIVSNLTRATGPEVEKKDTVFGDRSWNPGSLSVAHHSLTDKCEACHVKPFESVRDETCLTCHKDVHDHAAPVRLAAARGNLPLGQAALWKIAHAFGKEGPGACRDCHSEHKGPTRLTAPDQQFCADCHGRLKSNLPDTRLGDAADFGKLHPQFTARVIADPVKKQAASFSLDGKLREDNGLSFPHKLHLDPRGGVARMAKNIGAERGYGAGGLQCKDCHRPTEEGVRFQPIEMERDCEGCHSLAYERVGGIVRRLRHGDVEQLTADLLAADRGRPFVSNRKRPGEYGEGGLYRFRSSGSGWPGLQLKAALSDKGVCGECHRPMTVNGMPGVVPVSLPARYFDHGWFDHDAHKQEKCTTCHAADTSTSASDVLLPGIKTCRTCHLGEDAPKTKVPSGCAMCHGYHIIATGSADRKPDVNPSSPMKAALRRE